MRLEIRDLDALGRLSPIDVRAYLISQGWQPSGQYGDVATIYTMAVSKRETVEILLPKRQDFGDYAARMADIVASVADLEQRSQMAVFNDFVKSGFDIVRFRAPNADGDGTIALEQGVQLYDHARELIAAASNAAVKPKRAYSGATFDKTRDYLQSLRLGQTEVGSYILNILSPVPPALSLDQYDFFGQVEGAEPFARAVTIKLDRALQAAKSAVVEATASGDFEPFEIAVDEGVSGNLCQAVAALAQQPGGVDISVSWSRVRTAPGRASKYSFSQDNARILVEAAVKLKELEPETDVVIEGFVTGLQRKMDEFDGTAKINAFIGNKIRTVWATFQYEDYRKVIKAHDDKLPIRMDGDLVRQGRSTFLEHPRNLVVLENLDEDNAVEVDN